MYPMANQVLLQSSIIHGLILLIVIALTYEKIPKWMLIGIVLIIATSCWNHGTTNRLAMYCDRSVTGIIAAIILYVLLTTILPYSEYVGYGIILAALLWLSSYQYPRKCRNQLHFAAHTIATISMAAFLFLEYKH